MASFKTARFTSSGPADKLFRYQEMLRSNGRRFQTVTYINSSAAVKALSDWIVTSGNAEEIVRRAYRAVLNRDPDQGAEGYINNVMRENWSQQDVERELRKSDEFRNRR